MRSIRRVTYSNVISTVCLFLLLGGGTAVALNGANTVFSDDIVNGEVRTNDLANSAGKTYSNRVVVPWQMTSGTILNVPGFGRLELTTCNNNEAKVRWLNTSGSYEQVNSGPGLLGPGQYTSPNDPSGDLVIGRGTGASAGIAHVFMLYSENWLGQDRCAIMAQATAQAP